MTATTTAGHWGQQLDVLGIKGKQKAALNEAGINTVLELDKWLMDKAGDDREGCVAVLAKLDGLGKVTAQRIIDELEVVEGQYQHPDDGGPIDGEADELVEETAELIEEASGEVPPGQLGDWLDEVPENVQAAADEYEKAHREYQNKKAALNTAKENVIALMRESGCKRCSVRNGEKVLVYDTSEKVKLEARKRDDAGEE